MTRLSRTGQVIALMQAKPRTVKEMADLLKISVDNIWTHLSALRSMRLIDTIPGKSTGRRGRPECSYQLAEQQP